MSDIKCVVCGEPWEAWGRGDMCDWQWELFQAGAGCPSCEGTPNGWEPTHFEDTENGDGDPMLRIMAHADHEAGIAPKWERPTDPVLWECEGCGVQACRDLDSAYKLNKQAGDLYYNVPSKATCARWYRSHPLLNRDATDEPYAMIGDVVTCEYCHESCEQCSADINGQVDSTYFTHWQDGMSVHYVCSEECMSAQESEIEAKSWDAYGCADFRRALTKMYMLSDKADELLHAVSNDALYTHFHDFGGEVEENLDGASYSYRSYDRYTDSCADRARSALAKLLKGARNG